MASELEFDLQNIVDWSKKWFVDFHAGKTKLVLFDQSNKVTGVTDMKIWTGIFLRKNHLLRCWVWLSLLNWIGALTFSLLEIGALIHSMKFLSTEVALYLYESTIQPCMEHCCHVWAGAPSCYLELLEKLQKQIFRTVGPFTCYLSWNLGSSLKCSQLKSFL